jgi:hypothetical protein
VKTLFSLWWHVYEQIRLLRKSRYPSSEDSSSAMTESSKSAPAPTTTNVRKLGTRTERMRNYLPAPKVKAGTKIVSANKIAPGHVRPPKRIPLNEALPIDAFVPSRYDAHYVRGVIWWGFIRPLQSRQFVGIHHGAYELIFRTLVQKNYDALEVERTIDLLKRLHVLHTGAQGGLALNIKAELGKTPEAREIIRCSADALFLATKQDIEIIDTAQT